MNWIRRNARLLGAHIAELAKIAWRAAKPIVYEIAMIVVADLFDTRVLSRPRPA